MDIKAEHVRKTNNGNWRWEKSLRYIRKRLARSEEVHRGTVKPTTSMWQLYWTHFTVWCSFCVYMTGIYISWLEVWIFGNLKIGFFGIRFDWLKGGTIFQHSTVCQNIKPVFLGHGNQWWKYNKYNKYIYLSTVLEYNLEVPLFYLSSSTIQI